MMKWLLRLETMRASKDRVRSLENWILLKERRVQGLRMELETQENEITLMMERLKEESETR
ncbi:unnamed protein product [marine sediment metagenome]|uniref:Uncharacterized protein n=1 Tax=marine sediment metagenome TaxID=412755 RepID=X1JU13_9ZZZZ